MKRFFSLSLALLLGIAAVLAQTSFPRKFLLEQFTGEACGYCPYGMDCIKDFVDKQDSGKYVWIAHHYGYGTDEYTIAANSQVGKAMGVSGAPSACINRTKRKVDGTTAYAFHPGYFAESGAVPVNDADTALVNVIIDHTYDAATRTLTVYVHGQTLDTTAVKYKVCVYIKESGTIGAQHDYYDTYEGWSAFRHTKTVRTSLTNNALGASTDTIKNGEYHLDTITYNIPEAWNDTNCCIVAAVTKGGLTTDYTILNCEQTPLIDGTQGGENIKHGGITRVPVAETYPEEGTPQTPITFTQKAWDTQYVSKYYFATLGLASTTSVTASGYNCTPYLYLMYVTTSTAELSAGTYTISSTGNAGTFYAGYRNDEQFSIGGSQLRYRYLYSGSYYTMAQWLLTSGQVVVNEDGSMVIDATTLNGSPFHGVYSGSTGLQDVNASQSTSKFLQDGHLMIQHNGRVFDAAGKLLK